MKKARGILIIIAILISFGCVSVSAMNAGIMNKNRDMTLLMQVEHRIIMNTGVAVRQFCHGCHNHSQNDTNITGVLAYDGMHFSIDSVILNFGCHHFIENTMSNYDYDGDGTLEIILDELLGLVGMSITVTGYMGCNNHLMVTGINGLPYP